MAFLDDIGTHLAAASTPTQALTLGTNLFLGRRPDTPDTCVTVYETGGTAPELIFGSNTAPPVETRGLQVVVRAASYATSEALCTEVWTALCLIDGDVINTRRYLLAEPVQSPFALDRDDQGRMLHVCNFLVTREVPTLPSKVGTVTATPGDTEVVLSWTAPYAIGAITDYVVQYSTDDATWVTFADGTSAATTATVTGLVNGTLYYFRVAATNSEGTGPYSDSVTATPASSFTPLDLSPTLWLDASDATTITESGGAVSQWDDKSGNGNDLVQATASLQPETGLNTLNSKNVLFFASDEMTNTTSISSSSCVVAMVTTWNAGVRNGLYGGSSGSTPGLYQQSTGSTGWNSEPSSSTTYSIGSGSAGSVLLVSHGSTSYVRKDGVELSESGGPQSSTAGTSITHWGRLGRAGVYINGDIAEIIVVDGTLSAQQIADTETYLADKWGITLP